MIETLTVVTLGIIFLLYFRPGKTPPLENQLIIDRPGKYKLILAPKLNLAQPFIEAVIGRIAKFNDTSQPGSASQYMAIRDKQIAKKSGGPYLLAIIIRERIFCCIAEHPLSGNPGNYLETIKSRVGDLIKDLPAGDAIDLALGESIASAVLDVSQEMDIDVELLSS